MMISLFSFALSWVVYALVFYAITLVLPQFHSAYRESTLSVAFLIGFLDAALIKALRYMNFKVHVAVLFLIGVVVNYILIRGTSGGADTYYVTGHKAPLITAVVLAVAMIILDYGKRKVLADRR